MKTKHWLFCGDSGMWMPLGTETFSLVTCYPHIFNLSMALGYHLHLPRRQKCVPTILIHIVPPSTQIWELRLKSYEQILSLPEWGGAPVCTGGWKGHGIGLGPCCTAANQQLAAIKQITQLKASQGWQNVDNFWDWTWYMGFIIPLSLLLRIF